MSSFSTTDNERPDNENLPAAPPVVGIGASAGGLDAFKMFCDKIPVDTGLAFVLIPHLDPGHKSLMVEIISRHTEMPTLQVEQPVEIEPNHIYVIQPDRNLALEGGWLIPRIISRQTGINPPVDYFFRSLAIAQNERAIGVILSGTMSDGAMGVKDIKEYGGLVIAKKRKRPSMTGCP